MLGIPVPTAPSRAEMFELGACQDEFPQIFLFAGFSIWYRSLVRQQSSDKLWFAATSPFLTPPCHTERAAGSRDGWLGPKRALTGAPAPLGVTLGVTPPLHSRCDALTSPWDRATSPWGLLLVSPDLSLLSFYFQQPNLSSLTQPLNLIPLLGIFFKVAPNHCREKKSLSTSWDIKMLLSIRGSSLEDSTENHERVAWLQLCEP